MKIEVTAAVIFKSERFLICQRPPEKSCGLLWEFPGGKIEPGETAEECLIRECQEELGVTLRIHRKITEIEQNDPNRTIRLHFFTAEIVSGILAKKEHAAFRWITAKEINSYEFCPADLKMLKKISMDDFKL